MSGRQILVLCLAIAGGLIVVTCVGGSLLLARMFKEPENIDFSVEAPMRVTVGETFEVAVTIRNTSSRPQTLVSLNVWDRYLDGIAFIDSTPPFRQAYHVPIENTVCYEYGREIGGNGSIVVKYTAEALTHGDYDSYIDACINSELSFLTRPIRTVVEREQQPEPVGGSP